VKSQPTVSRRLRLSSHPGRYLDGRSGRRRSSSGVLSARSRVAASPAQQRSLSSRARRRSVGGTNRWRWRQPAWSRRAACTLRACRTAVKPSDIRGVVADSSCAFLRSPRIPRTCATAAAYEDFRGNPFRRYVLHLLFLEIRERYRVEASDACRAGRDDDRSRGSEALLGHSLGPGKCPREQ